MLSIFIMYNRWKPLGERHIKRAQSPLFASKSMISVFLLWGQARGMAFMVPFSPTWPAMRCPVQAILFAEPLTAVSIAGLGMGVAGLLMLELPEEALLGAAGMFGGDRDEGCRRAVWPVERLMGHMRDGMGAADAGAARRLLGAAVGGCSITT